MTAERRLIARFRKDLGHSPIVLNVIFSFALAIVEKIVEVEFACPCSPYWNTLFSAAIFIIPAVMTFLLILMIRHFKFRNRPPKWAYSFLPPLVWQILIFLNGEYFVCLVTYWRGTFVSVEQTFLKWCTPNITLVKHSPEKLLAYSHRMFIISQGIGLVLVMFVGIFLLGYAISKSCSSDEEQEEQKRQKEPEKTEEEQELNELAMP